MHVSGERCPVLWIGQVALVALPVEIDITNADQVREELLSVINGGAATLIADLSTTTFCDSAGVGALVRTFRRASASGGEMRLVVGTLPVQRVLAITGIDRLLDTYPSVTAALAGPDDQVGQNGRSEPGAATRADSDGGTA